MIDPYDRVTVGRYSDGTAMVVNRRSKEMLELVEHQTGIDTTITQGSYHPGTSASAGTHDGGGVIDLRVTDYTDTQRNKLLAGLRVVGYIAWYRTPDQGNWPYHIHIVAKGDAELSPAAKQQVADANAGYNGLASHLYDGLNLNVPTFDWTEYITVLTDIINRLATVEEQITTNNPLGRAQYAYKTTTDGTMVGGIKQRLGIVEGQVSENTDARAQLAYSRVISAAAGGDPNNLQDRMAAVETDLPVVETKVTDLDTRVTTLEAAAPKA